MQKVIIDTNVFVSALIQKSYPHLIIRDLFVEGKIELCISDELLEEYYAVLNRRKFSRYPDFVSNSQLLISEIEDRSRKYFPKEKLSIISDKDDNKLLELCKDSNAEFLITGNTKDFTMQIYGNTRILTPKEYWDKHRPRK